MPDDLDALLDDLLARWHHWCSQAIAGTGFPTESPACRLWRASRQYDDCNGALDTDLDNRIMAGVDHSVHRLHDPYRAAIHMHARNLCTGCAVWRSPRLPEDHLARATIVMDARSMLLRLFHSDGIV